MGVHYQPRGLLFSPPQIPTPPPTPPRNPPASRIIPIIELDTHLLEQLKKVVTCNLTADAHPNLETRGIAVSLFRENSKESLLFHEDSDDNCRSKPFLLSPAQVLKDEFIYLEKPDFRDFFELVLQKARMARALDAGRLDPKRIQEQISLARILKDAYYKILYPKLG